MTTMYIKGITFVGTRTSDRAEMTRFARDVLGLAPRAVDGADGVDGVDAVFFDLPDGSSFAVAPSDGPPERTVGFLVDDVEQAARELRDAGVETDDVSVGAGFRYVHLRAPDGRLYELVEKVG